MLRRTDPKPLRTIEEIRADAKAYAEEKQREEELHIAELKKEQELLIQKQIELDTFNERSNWLSNFAIIFSACCLVLNLILLLLLTVRVLIG